MSVTTKEQAAAMQRNVDANRQTNPWPSPPDKESNYRVGIIDLRSEQVVLRNHNIPPAKANLTPRDRGMNKTETKFSHRLEAMKRAGDIVDWRFEALKFRLADMTTYTPDFLVIGTDGSITLIDTKAYWKKAGKVDITEDANVKVKVVADLYPWFAFQTAWEQGGLWQFKTY